MLQSPPLDHEPTNRSYEMSSNFYNGLFKIEFTLPTITPGPVVAYWLDLIRNNLEELAGLHVRMGLAPGVDPAKIMKKDLEKLLKGRVAFTKVIGPPPIGSHSPSATLDPFHVRKNTFAKTSTET